MRNDWNGMVKSLLFFVSVVHHLLGHLICPPWLASAPDLLSLIITPQSGLNWLPAIISLGPMELVAFRQHKAVQVPVFSSLHQPLLLKFRYQHVPFLYRPHNLRQEFLLLLELRGALLCICGREREQLQMISAKNPCCKCGCIWQDRFTFFIHPASKVLLKSALGVLQFKLLSTETERNKWPLVVEAGKCITTDKSDVFVFLTRMQSLTRSWGQIHIVQVCSSPKPVQTRTDKVGNTLHHLFDCQFLGAKRQKRRQGEIWTVGWDWDLKGFKEGGQGDFRWHKKLTQHILEGRKIKSCYCRSFHNLNHILMQTHPQEYQIFYLWPSRHCTVENKSEEN